MSVRVTRCYSKLRVECGWNVRLRHLSKSKALNNAFA
jgi:hypothetical protein